MFKSAIVVAAVLGFSSVAFVDEAVKSGGAADKPARAPEEGTVKSQGAGSKPSRNADDGKVKSAGKADKSSRAADEAKK